MSTKTTPTDIRYGYMHIDMTNIFLYLFTRIISVVEDLDENFEYLAQGDR
ncbi:MAG: hypothetical protein WAK17_25315 [Candidatus Nitrosopolaris sp.]|jgi:hypothetical protein